MEDHLQFTPEQWTQILQNALLAHRANPQDREALAAIIAANSALNAYERPAITAGERTLPEGTFVSLPSGSIDLGGYGNPIEALKGTAEGARDALIGALKLTLKAPVNPSGAIDDMVAGLAAVPGEIMSGDPRRIGRVGGGVATGVGGAKLLKSAGGVVGDFARRPGLRNAQIAEETAGNRLRNQALQELLEQRRGTAPLQEEILANRAAASGQAPVQAGLKTELMQGQVRQQPARTSILEEQATRGPFQTKSAQGLAGRQGGLGENLELRNELLRRALMEAEEGGVPPVEVPSPTPPVPPSAPSAATTISPDPVPPRPFGLPLVSPMESLGFGASTDAAAAAKVAALDAALKQPTPFSPEMPIKPKVSVAPEGTILALLDPQRQPKLSAKPPIAEKGAPSEPKSGPAIKPKGKKPKKTDESTVEKKKTPK